MPSKSISSRLTNAWIKAGRQTSDMKSRESMKWFHAYIKKNLTYVNFAKLKADGVMVSRPRVGQIITYLYDAKTKDKLPIWDAFPLVLVISVDGNSWKGLSLHYLPATVRMTIILALLKDGTPRGKASTVEAIAYHYSQVIKMYLADHLKSPILNVDQYAWEQVIFLPTARWQSN